LSEHEGRYSRELHTSLDATDASSFDDLAKGLASGTLSRRKALRMMGAAMVGGALASIPGVAWAAKPGGCASGVTCKGKCCAVGASCVGRGRNQACACPQGQSVCGGVCRDLATDVLNCGACGSACGAGLSCVGGQCRCADGTTLCPGNNSCVQICPSGQTLNPTNCRCEAGVGGTCTTITDCQSGLTCQNGTCVSVTSGVGGTCTDRATNAECAPELHCCTNATPEHGMACAGCGYDGTTPHSGYCVSCHNGAYFDPAECRCVCPPDLPSECRVEGNPNVHACCPAGTVCSTTGPGGSEILCTPV
jgi:hypothetical protein